MNTKKVVLVVMDAFRSDYLTENNTPFLYSIAKSGTHFKEVSQSRSFCERSEMFTGLSPIESGYFTAIGFDPKDSPYRNIPFLNVLYQFEKIIPKNRLYRVYKRYLNAYLKRKANGMSSYSIPLNILKYFNLTEDKFDFRSSDGLDGHRSLFIDLDKKGLTTYYDAFTSLNFVKSSSDKERRDDVVDKITGEYNFFPIYQAVMDQRGHDFGPESQEVKQSLVEFDAQLAEFYNKVLARNPETKFLFLGDHGMTNVVDSIDFESKFKRFRDIYGFKLGIDFIYFLDSTIMRTWFLSDKVEAAFKRFFLTDDEVTLKGSFLDEKEAIKQHIPLGDSRYGDMIWMANNGVLVYPDFFHRTKMYKGMHGYDVSEKDSKGLCIVNNRDVEFRAEENILLTDVYRLLRGQLGLGHE